MSKPFTTPQAAAVAELALTGATPAEIASQVGLSESKVSLVLSRVETQSLFSVLLAPHTSRLAVLTDKALSVLEDGMTATTRSGDVDHEIRLQAVKQFGGLLKLLPVPKTEATVVTSGDVPHLDMATQMRLYAQAVHPAELPQ